MLSVISRPTPSAGCSAASSPPRHLKLSVHKNKVTGHKTYSHPSLPILSNAKVSLRSNDSHLQSPGYPAGTEARVLSWYSQGAHRSGEKQEGLTAASPQLKCRSLLEHTIPNVLAKGAYSPQKSTLWSLRCVRTPILVTHPKRNRCSAEHTSHLEGRKDS